MLGFGPGGVGWVVRVFLVFGGLWQCVWGEILCITAIQNCQHSSDHFRSLYIITESTHPGERYNVSLDSKQM